MVYAALPPPDRFDFPDDEMRARAMAFHDPMKRRHSVRELSNRPVPREVIEACVRAAGTAPSGANLQPSYFFAVSDPGIKRRIRDKAAEEERRFYEGAAGDEWLKALEPIGRTAETPHLEIAPWLIVFFAQRWGEFDDGRRFKNS